MVRYGRERARTHGSCPVDRGRYGEVKEVRSRLTWVTSLPARAMVTSEPRLLLGLMCGSVALMQP